MSDTNLAKAQENRKIKKLLSNAPTDFNADQLLKLLQKTPDKHKYTRPAKGGGTWDYVTGTYVEKVLNYVTGWNWDFEIKEHGSQGDVVWVLGRLIIRVGNTTIAKEQFGRADVKKKKDGVLLDYGNDLKAAATDSLKKCASLLGIASDIYGKEEFKEVKREELLNLPTPEPIQKRREEKSQSEVVADEVANNLEDKLTAKRNELRKGQNGN